MFDVATADPSLPMTALCGECETAFPASHKPDFCGACGAIDGPWVLITTRVAMAGASLRVTPRARLVGTWSAEARALALVALGSLVEGA